MENRDKNKVTFRSNFKYMPMVSILVGPEFQGDEAVRQALKVMKQTGECLMNINFAGLSLRGMDLSAMDFRQANFSGADLTGANLSRALLEGASFEGACLMNADLSNADLRDTNLKDAVLEGAILEGTCIGPLDYEKELTPAEKALLERVMGHFPASSGSDKRWSFFPPLADSVFMQDLMSRVSDLIDEGITTTRKDRFNFESWIEDYRPVKNPVDGNASHDGLMHETYGAELDLILAADGNRVWTLIECGDAEVGSVVYLVAGYHLVNRIGHFITEVPFEEGCDLEIYMDRDRPSPKDYVFERIGRVMEKTFLEHAEDLVKARMDKPGPDKPGPDHAEAPEEMPQASPGP